MAVTHISKSLTQMFNESDTRKFIINDIPYMESVTDEDIFHQLMTVYDTDVMSTVPKCNCPDEYGLSGRYRVGQICGRCGYEVKEPHEHMDPNVWLRALRVPEFGMVPFISPHIWMMLTKLLYRSRRNKSKIDYLRWLCDDTYQLPPGSTSAPSYKPMEEVLHKAMGGKRGYISFISNLDAVFQCLIANPFFKNKKHPTSSTSYHLELLYNIYKQDMKYNNGQGIFTEYLPIINKQIFVMEMNTKGKYATLKSAININVVQSWRRLCTEIKEREELGEKPVTADKIGRETAKVIAELTKLYLEYQDDYVFKKSGLMRKHNFGARSHFTFRSVIVSREGPHDRRGVEIPWSVAMTIFQPHLANKLIRDGYNHREIKDMLYRGVKKYDPYLETLLKELQSEAPNGRIPLIVHRNQMVGFPRKVTCGDKTMLIAGSC